ncbi:MAG: hypothetical protein U1F50_19280 [Rubrivivax sp.]
MSDLRSFGRSSAGRLPIGGTEERAHAAAGLLTALRQQTGHGQSNGCGSVGNTINVTA